MMIGMANGLLDCNIEVGVEKKVGTITINGVTYDRYVKIIDCGNLPNTTNKNVPHNITGIIGVLNISGAARDSNGYALPLPYLYIGSSVAENSIRINLTSTNVYIQTLYNWSDYKGLVVIEYYK